MKSLQKLRLLLLLGIVLTAVQSCQIEEDLIDALNDTTETTATDNENEDPDSSDTTTDDDSTSDDTTDSDSSTDTTSSAEGEEGNITRYLVQGGVLVKEIDYKVSDTELEWQKDEAKHQEVWELTKKLVPTAYLAKMSHFMIFAGEDIGTAGYVYPTSNDLSKWEMGIAIDFAYYGGSLNSDGDLAHTIIHEFGHILTLDNDQLDAAIAESDCSNYFPGEGCAKTPAYINKFYSNFWADIANEHSNIGEDDFDAQGSFYDKYQDRFVTNYASTNPAEDIAEVFAAFVIRNSGPNGAAIAEQKIQLMYDHSELVGYRDFIKGNLASAKGKRALRISDTWEKSKGIKHGNCVRRTR